MILQCCLALLFCAAAPFSEGMGMGKKAWTFELLSVETTSSDESLVKTDVDMQQIERGTYGVSGTWTLNYDIEEGDNNMIEARVDRRAEGSSEYKVTPFTMNKQHFYSFLNTFYKDVLMESFSKCSDLPVFKDKFKPPIEKKTYTLTNCRFTNDGLPPFMQDGFYKVFVHVTGTVDYTFEVIAKVEQDT